MINMTLHPHQERAVEAIKDSLRGGHKRPVLQAPTGMGKTVIAAHIVESALQKGNPSVFVVPRIELIDQTVERFAANGIGDVGVIQADHHLTNWNKPIQVCSVQTLMRKTSWPKGALTIVDECHLRFKWYADYFSSVGHPIIGLSATPWSRGLGKKGWYDDLLQPIAMTDLINQGYLSPFKVFAPSHPDLTNVKDVGEDYHEGQLAEVMSDGVLVADVVDTWLKLGEGRATLCFAVNRSHAKCLQERFEKAGVPTGYVDCETGDHERARVREAFASGDIKIVCNVDVLGIGVDWDVRCIILARPTRSIVRHVQTVGRGLRTAEGKDHLLILDHGDSHLRLGFVIDIGMTKLHDGKIAKKLLEKHVALPRECKQCHNVVPAGTRACPVCGYERKIEPGEVRTLNGQLVEFGGTTVSPPPKKLNRIWTYEDKCAFYGELRYYAQSYGYKLGWAVHKYKDRFGVLPWDERVKHAMPRMPTQETLRWIKSQQIRWGKSKRSQHGENSTSP